MRSKHSQNLRIELPFFLLLIAMGAMLLAVSCAAIPDVPLCVEINPTRGFCTNTISDKDFYIDESHPVQLLGDDKPKTWWERRPFMVLVPVTSWKELKSYIIKQCKRTNCDKYVQSWDRKINELEQGASP